LRCSPRCASIGPAAALATFAFAAVALLFMGFTWAETGSPFTFAPWIPLTLTTALCGYAAWRG
jgi:hypothetical protein